MWRGEFRTLRSLIGTKLRGKVAGEGQTLKGKVCGAIKVVEGVKSSEGSKRWRRGEE